MHWMLFAGYVQTIDTHFANCSNHSHGVPYCLFGGRPKSTIYTACVYAHKAYAFSCMFWLREHITKVTMKKEKNTHPVKDTTLFPSYRCKWIRNQQCFPLLIIRYVHRSLIVSLGRLQFQPSLQNVFFRSLFLSWISNYAWMEFHAKREPQPKSDEKLQ